MATDEHHHKTFASNIGAGSRQPLPARAATRSAAPAASVTFSAPLHRSDATPQPLHLHSTRLAPGSGHLRGFHRSPRHRPPACRSLPPPLGLLSLRAAPWQPPPTPRDDRYLDLRVSKLMFVNKFFPADTRKPIKELASHVDAAFRTLNMDKCHLCLAIQMATQDDTPLCGYLVDDILRLRDLLDRAYATPAGGEWVREALSQAVAPRRPTRTTSSGSDTSSSARPRRRDGPSSGRGNSKRTLTETSDSDDRQSRHQGRHHPDKRLATAHIFHATDDGSDAPSFPPRIFRYRTRSRRPRPGVSPPRTDSIAPVTNDLPSYSISLKQLPPRLSLP